MAKTLLIAAPSSGSGKTSICMGLIRALTQQGSRVSAVKIGPDYIDSGWHSMASGQLCWNVDPWAMRDQTQDAVVHAACADANWCIIEGVMGLFDGAIDGKGSSFDVACRYELPIILVVDASRQADSIAALVSGFHHFKGANNIAGVVLNRVASCRHEMLLRHALLPLNIPIVGCLPRFEEGHIGSRHLGLYQAGEKADDKQIIQRLAQLTAEHLDFQLLEEIASKPKRMNNQCSLEAPFFNEAKTIAIARDAAFSFIYRHHIEAWIKQGSKLIYFSPLASDSIPKADAVYFPGGYPELHLSQLSQSTTIKELAMCNRSMTIYGECGGYMVLGQSIIDSNGEDYKMAGLLPHRTSFAKPKRALGYRRIKGLEQGTFLNKNLRGHEFHYTQADDSKRNLFESTDAKGGEHEKHGDAAQGVAGSYLHIIDSDD